MEKRSFNDLTEDACPKKPKKIDLNDIETFILDSTDEEVYQITKYLETRVHSLKKISFWKEVHDDILEQGFSLQLQSLDESEGVLNDDVKSITLNFNIIASTMDKRKIDWKFDRLVDIGEQPIWAQKFGYEHICDSGDPYTDYNMNCMVKEIRCGDHDSSTSSEFSETVILYYSSNQNLPQGNHFDMIDQTGAYISNCSIVDGKIMGDDGYIGEQMGFIVPKTMTK